ncbi:polysaccharide polymerase [Lactiplantibacillus plantarum]|nr:polysaccharide polymerase [Lactiplantibacillus plantarum]
MIYVVVCLLSIGIYCLIAPQLNYAEHGISHQDEPVGVSRTKVAVLCSAVPVAFISAVRYGVGTDYFNTYIGGYWRVLSGWKGDEFEYGYSLLLHVLFKVSPQNPNALIIATSVIFVGFTYLGILRSSVNIPLSIILFFVSRYYFIGMNGVRQFMAISIMLFSLKYVIDQKLIKYIICAVLAFGFHYSIIIFVPIYFFTNFSVSRKILPLVIACDFALVAGGYRILYSFIGNTKYYRLTQHFGVAGRNFTLMMIFINFVILVLYYAVYSKLKDDHEYRLFLNIQLISFLLTLLLRTIPQIERVYWTFSFPIIIGLPYIISKYPNRIIRWVIECIIVVLLGTYCFYDIAILHDHSVLPYNWILH